MEEARFEKKTVVYRVKTDFSVLDVKQMANDDYPDYGVHSITRIDRGTAISQGLKMGIESDLSIPPGYTLYVCDLMEDTTSTCQGIVNAKEEADKLAKQRAKEKAALDSRLAAQRAKDAIKAAELAQKQAEEAEKALADLDPKPRSHHKKEDADFEKLG